MDFPALESLRTVLEEINLKQVASLRAYHDAVTGGFFHQYDEATRVAGDPSTASTATCVLSLAATGNWPEWRQRAPDLAKHLLMHDWKSAGLPDGNVFSVSFILEAVTKLLAIEDADCLARQTSPVIAADPENQEKIAKAESLVREAIHEDDSLAYVQLAGYPKSAYLTQLAVRVLKQRGKLDDTLGRKVREWASQEMDHQLSLMLAGTKSADLYQLAYTVILVVGLTEPGRIYPDRNAIIDAALTKLFAQQADDGSWPRSRALFHYPKVGNAYCYEYEMLVQLLSEKGLQDKLLAYLPALSRAAGVLRPSAFQLKTDGWGWSSGHHPQLEGPESWTTASVFHFAHELDRLLAEAIRRSIFEYLHQPYPWTATSRPPEKVFADPERFLDCPLYLPDSEQGLRQILLDSFVEPIQGKTQLVELGRPLPKSTPMSAIFFGPPGTSKTELTKQIADCLRWPHLTIDPSHFIRKGLDQVQAEADQIFNMLAATEQVVVLLDEFDEMVRARQHETEVLSRFLTTAMLPKLAQINERRRIVFIVATNFIDRFDFAISRHGRFDMLVQVLPPSAQAKQSFLQKQSPITYKLLQPFDRGLMSKMADLTYAEFEQLRLRWAAATGRDEALQMLDEQVNACTLNSRADPQDPAGKTWGELAIEQRAKIRVFTGTGPPASAVRDVKVEVTQPS